MSDSNSDQPAVVHTLEPLVALRQPDRPGILQILTASESKEKHPISIAYFFCAPGGDLDEAYAQRMLDCYNACQGMIDPATTIRELLEAAKNSRRTLSIAIKADWCGATDADVAEHPVVKALDAAIAKAEGKEGGAQ